MKAISYYRNKADKSLQEWGRLKYTKCEICGKPISCLHHYFPKSVSSALRYEIDNLIPICQGCHFSHHNGNPMIHNTVNEKRGKDWIKKLEKKKYNITKPSIGYYKQIIAKFGS